MQHNRRFFRLAATAAAVLFAAAVAFAQGHEHGQMQGQAQDKQQVIKVGKKGEVNFDQPTQVGDVTVPVGHYVFQHKVSGDDHFIKFVGAKEMQHFGTAMTTPMQMGPTTSKEIKCSIEPLSQKAKQTAVTIDTEGGVRRVTKITFAGENVVHLL